MLMYVMKHYPGNTNNSWTRQFFGDIAHGVTRFDMFLFEPSTSGYTCDYVDSDGGAYPTVREGLNMLGSFEDIVEAGSNLPAVRARLFLLLLVFLFSCRLCVISFFLFQMRVVVRVCMWVCLEAAQLAPPFPHTRAAPAQCIW